MNTRIPSSAPVQATQTTARVTPTQPKVPFAEVMGRTASLGAQAALGVVPGGQAIAAAVRGTGASAGLAGGVPAAQTMSAPLGAGAISGANLAGNSLGSAAIAPAAAGAVSPGALRNAMAPGGAASSAEGPGGTGGSGTGVNFDSALAQSADMNMYYLSIQERVNAENRSFTTLSNVMKAEHETVKTAIGNIR